MNLLYSSTGFIPDQWKILLDLENVCYFLVDIVEDQELINWFNCQREWQAVAHSRNATLFRRKTIDLVVLAV